MLLDERLFITLRETCQNVGQSYENFPYTTYANEHSNSAMYYDL